MKTKGKELSSFAAFPMYDLPELRDATDALWREIALRLEIMGIDAPCGLTSTTEPASIWAEPSLLLAQTCGYPLMTTLKGKVSLVATPGYGAAGCNGASYRSAIVVRQTARATCLADLQGTICAVNDLSSNSGMNVLRAAIAPLSRHTRFFKETLLTGSHAASVDAVSDGRADVAALDCVTWAHLQRLRPAATHALRVLDWTVPTPGLPFITSMLTTASTSYGLSRALAEIAADRALVSLRAELLLEDFHALPLGAYDVIMRLEQDAVSAGYPALL